jgi:hypothetical protein
LAALVVWLAFALSVAVWVLVAVRVVVSQPV